MPKPPPTLISKAALASFVNDLFLAAGLSAENAATMADIFTWADARGVGSHGVSRIPRYLELLESGEAKAQPDIRVERPFPAMLMVEADSAPGPVAMSLAVREAIKAARETGVAWASVRGTVHTGAIGYYTSLAAEQGMACIAMVAGVPNMAYFGSRANAVATSPLSIAVPAAGDVTPVLDMATATIALGKINQFKIAGKSLPEGAAMSADGQLTTDPNVAKIPMPMAGAKGAGLSLMFEFLTSVLVGNSIFSEYHSDVPGGKRHRQNASIIVVNVDAFGGLEGFKEGVGSALDTLKGLPTAEGVDELLYPGERGSRMSAERSANGIPVPAPTWNKLVKGAEKLGVQLPEVISAD
ncbi:MAG: Ldh family oxidoreductase [Spongiibacteraceae bacterium]|nr:Ldh family oxidoreductase [Spongiibacteraceae bacterium]